MLLLAMGMVTILINYQSEGQAEGRGELLRRIDWWGSLTLVLWVSISFLSCTEFLLRLLFDMRQALIVFELTERQHGNRRDSDRKPAHVPQL